MYRHHFVYDSHNVPTACNRRIYQTEQRYTARGHFPGNDTRKKMGEARPRKGGTLQRRRPGKTNESSIGGQSLTTIPFYCNILISACAFADDVHSYSMRIFCRTRAHTNERTPIFPRRYITLQRRVRDVVVDRLTPASASGMLFSAEVLQWMHASHYLDLDNAGERQFPHAEVGREVGVDPIVVMLALITQKPPTAAGP